MKKLVVLGLAFVMTVAFASFGFAMKKDVEFAGGGAGKVIFSHEQHTEKVGMDCKECHTKLFKMKKGSTEGITMAKMEAGENCGACHNGEKAFSVKDEASCPKCHQK